MTFKEYLSARVAGFDALGDLIRLLRADPKLPDVHNKDELKSYISGRRYWPDVDDAALKLWTDYLQHNKRTTKVSN